MAKRATRRGRTSQGKAQAVTHLQAPEDEAYQAEQEQQREQVYADAENLAWNGVALEAWSEGRQRLLDHLCAVDVPLPGGLSELPMQEFVDALFPRAVKMLFLLHHTPEQFLHLRPKLIAVIEDWGTKHVPAATFEDKVMAVQFLIRVQSAHNKLQAMVRPGKSRRKDDEGN